MLISNGHKCLSKPQMGLPWQDLLSQHGSHLVLKLTARMLKKTACQLCFLGNFRFSLPLLTIFPPKVDGSNLQVSGFLAGCRHLMRTLVSRAHDCRGGGCRFHSRGRTITQLGLKMTEKWRYSICTASSWIFVWLGWSHKMAVPTPVGDIKIVSPISNFMLNALTLK